MLTAIPAALTSLQALRELNVTFNRIAVLEGFAFGSLPNLEVLYLDKNPIANIKTAAFGGLDSLRELYIRNTSLAYVPNAAIARTTTLQLLDLSNNAIAALFDYGFPGMTNLTEIRLSENPLSNISLNAFTELVNGQVLDLENCLLTEIPRAVARMPRLHALNMEGNPVICTCATLQWVEDWRASEGLIASIDGHCQNSGQLIQQFINVDVQSCP